MVIIVVMIIVIVIIIIIIIQRFKNKSNKIKITGFITVVENRYNAR